MIQIKCCLIITTVLLLDVLKNKQKTKIISNHSKNFARKSIFKIFKIIPNRLTIVVHVGLNYTYKIKKIGWNQYFYPIFLDENTRILLNSFMY